MTQDEGKLNQSSQMRWLQWSSHRAQPPDFQDETLWSSQTQDAEVTAAGSCHNG
jgi:hypothetical protein